MPFEIKKEEGPKKTFILARALHLTKDEKMVEESDPAGVKVLGGKGYAMYEEEAKHYGLDESHRFVEESKEEPKAEESAKAEATAVEPEKEDNKPAEELKGKLPDDFPGKAALDEADPPVHTYNQVRKHLADGTLIDIPGIGKATAQKIEEALSQAPDEKE